MNINEGTVTKKSIAALPASGLNECVDEHLLPSARSGCREFGVIFVVSSGHSEHGSVLPGKNFACIHDLCQWVSFVPGVETGGPVTQSKQLSLRGPCNSDKHAKCLLEANWVEKFRRMVMAVSIIRIDGAEVDHGGLPKHPGHAECLIVLATCSRCVCVCVCVCVLFW